MDRYLVTLGLMLALVSGDPDIEYCEYPKPTRGRWHAETFLIGTQVVYYCNENFEGRHEDSVINACVLSSGEVTWRDNSNCCIKEGPVLNTDHECEADDFSSNMEETTWTDSCGPPPLVANATMNFTLTLFPVGQKLVYSVNGNPLTEDGVDEVLTCEDCNGNPMWVNEADGCPDTNLLSVTEASETTYRQEGSGTASVPRYFVTSSILFILIILLVIFGTTLWKEIFHAGECRKLKKTKQSRREEEHERDATAIPLSEDK